MVSSNDDLPIAAVQVVRGGVKEVGGQGGGGSSDTRVHLYSTRSLSTTSHLYELKRLVHAVEVTVYTCTVKVIEYNLTFL